MNMKGIVWLAGIAGFLIAQPLAAQSDAELDEKVDPTETMLPVKADQGALSIAAGTNDFGVLLFGQLGKEPDNQLMSPASISTAFGMAYAGAKGDTAKQIAAVLHYPQGLDDFHGSFGQLLDTMQIDRIGRKMSVNNAIWLQNETVVLPEYQALVARSYAAGLKRTDFKSDPEVARLTINRWVEEKTNNKIKDLLSPLNVSKDTRSVLVNTIYMKADWAVPFESQATKVEDFTLPSGVKQKQQLMNQRNRYAYAELDGIQAIALPYRGGETEMVVLLPRSEKGLPKFEKQLTPAKMRAIFKALEAPEAASDVILTLPKFKIEQRYELKKTFAAMGMNIPFSNKSDFSGMKLVRTDSPNPEDWNFKIEDVIHQTFVEVEEKGTEAAAATAITMIIVTSAPRTPPPPPKIFRADHPFLFVIRDRRTKAMLFIGRYGGDAQAMGN
jgi:serpin B